MLTDIGNFADDCQQFYLATDQHSNSPKFNLKFFTTFWGDSFHSLMRAFFVHFCLLVTFIKNVLSLWYGKE
ncbi:hypothetical protein D0T51_11515 [Parabacteroides sp. 52]|nr:hypothetical protein [Parabacteroides sp. 52]